MLAAADDDSRHAMSAAADAATLSCYAVTLLRADIDVSCC